MTMSSGFFDSVDHDRRYTAMQWGQIMDYLINDGVYLIYPESGVRYNAEGEPNKLIRPFYVSLVTDKDSYFNPGASAVSIGPGRAWFDHTWTWVQTPEIVQLPPYSDTADRYDVVVLTMDKSFAQRSNYFRVLQGAPGAASWKEGVSLQGSYMHNDDVHDVPIAYILRTRDPNKKDLEITQLVGESCTPYVANVAEGSFDVTELFSKWDEDWRAWENKLQLEYDAWHNLFGSSDEAGQVEWKEFLDNRAADFMRWLKLYDRAYHTWYQGAVNWTYEYIRNLQSEEESLQAQWTSAIQKAQDLLENGFTEYTQKIDEILKKFEDIDNLVDDKMAELQQEFDRAVEELKQDISNQTKELITEVITEQMNTIIEQVIAQASPDLMDGLKSEVENVVNDVLNSTFDDRLADLEKRFTEYVNSKMDTLDRTIAQVESDYMQFLSQIEDQIKQKVFEALGTSEDIQRLFEEYVANQLEPAVANVLNDVKEEWVNSILETIRTETQQLVDNIFNEKFETEKQDLIEYVKAQVREITDQAVDERFNKDFEIKYTELETGLNDHIDSKTQEIQEGLNSEVQTIKQDLDTKTQEIKEELAEGLTLEVQNKFNEQFDVKYGELEKDLNNHIDSSVSAAQQDLHETLSNELSQNLTEALTQTVTDQIGAAEQRLSDQVDTEVQNEFDSRFAEKQSELESKIDSTLNDGISDLSGQLTSEVDEKFADVQQDILSKADAAVQESAKTLNERINQALSSVYKPQGSSAFDGLPQSLDSSMLGNVYNVTDQFTTDDRFIGGSGHSYPEGTNIAVVADGDTYKFDVFSGLIDLSPYATNASLDEVRQSVSDISTEVDQTLDERLAAIQETLDSINTTLQSQAGLITEAKNAADAAQGAADKANTAAEAAKTSAASAQASASAAQSTADEAVTAAGKAQTDADEAAAAASTAQSTAETAQNGVDGINSKLTDDFLEKG